MISGYLAYLEDKPISDGLDLVYIECHSPYVSIANGIVECAPSECPVLWYHRSATSITYEEDREGGTRLDAAILECSCLDVVDALEEWSRERG